MYMDLQGAKHTCVVIVIHIIYVFYNAMKCMLLDLTQRPLSHTNRKI